MPTVLVTGANRGIGQALAKTFLADGWKVYAAARGEDATVPEGCLPVQLDITDPQSIVRLKDRLALEPLDVLWNNAGVYLDKGQSLSQLSDEDWLSSFAINCIAPIRLSEALADNVAGSHHKVIAYTSTKMASLAGHGAGSYAYRSSKTALNMAVRCMTHDLADQGIASLMLHPGWVRTDMGGSNADIDVSTSAEGMKSVVLKVDDANRAAMNGGYFNYDGSVLPW